ncbi:SDR family oxidoreductase [Singulisphaera sp. Ch08]|uniref:SDR family oxidoreductase n=1 Tax=Singulisphaera sp. Ch08 TaxID=3120278 RepID=A0AAU7CMG8_9BACT
MHKHKALVTGGSRGIGAEIAISLRRDGVEVIAPSRSELDLLDPASIDQYIEIHREDGVDILINNAGINPIAALEDVTAEDWARTLQVNLTAPFRLIQGFSPGMKSAGWGRVVNISSIWAVASKPGRAPYSSTKSGLSGLTRTTALELAPHGVLVNAVCPGYVETELTRANNTPEQLEVIRGTIPLGRLAQPEEIARFVAFLSSPANTYLVGQSLVIDGGFTCQ